MRDLKRRVVQLRREDMLELTRRMTLSRNCFTRAAGAYMDSEGYIDDTYNVNFQKMKSSDRSENLEIAKQVPFAETNHQLVGYRIPDEARGKDSIYQLLLGIRSCNLKNDLLLEVLYEQIGEAYSDPAGGDYAIDIYHGVYDVRRTGSDGLDQGESEEVYDFLVGAVSPLGENYHRKAAEFGFLFPAFLDRSEWDHMIEIYHRMPERREEKLLELFLGQE